MGVLLLLVCFISTEDIKESNINIYVYNFKPFTYRFVNPLKKADEEITYRPSIHLSK